MGAHAYPAGGRAPCGHPVLSMSLPRCLNQPESYRGNMHRHVCEHGGERRPADLARTRCSMARKSHSHGFRSDPALHPLRPGCISLRQHREHVEGENALSCDAAVSPQVINSFDRILSGQSERMALRAQLKIEAWSQAAGAGNLTCICTLTSHCLPSTPFFPVADREVYRNPGIAAGSIHLPFEMVGGRFLWWTWHDSHASVFFRLLGVPFGSLSTFAALASSLSFLLRITLPSSSSSATSLPQALFALVSSSLLSVPLAAIQLAICHLDDQGSVLCSRSLFPALPNLKLRSTCSLSMSTLTMHIPGTRVLDFEQLMPALRWRVGVGRVPTTRSTALQAALSVMLFLNEPCWGFFAIRWTEEDEDEDEGEDEDEDGSKDEGVKPEKTDGAEPVKKEGVKKEAETKEEESKDAKRKKNKRGDKRGRQKENAGEQEQKSAETQEGKRKGKNEASGKSSGEITEEEEAREETAGGGGGARRRKAQEKETPPTPGAEPSLPAAAENTPAVTERNSNGLAILDAALRGRSRADAGLHVGVL
eukprot:3468492-Rhodomonas_salina.1